MNSLSPLLDRLEAAGAEIASRRPAVEAGAPWPVGAVAQGSGEAEWGPTEVLAHVAEMLPYWLGEVERVLGGASEDGAAVPFGRVASDPIRSATVVRDATLPPRELFDRIASAQERYRRRLPELDEHEISARGIHPTRGELTVGQMVERFAVVHIEEHAEQLAKIVG
jgi:hypothetical protein